MGSPKLPFLLLRLILHPAGNPRVRCRIVRVQKLPRGYNQARHSMKSVDASFRDRVIYMAVVPLSPHNTVIRDVSRIRYHGTRISRDYVVDHVTSMTESYHNSSMNPTKAVYFNLNIVPVSRNYRNERRKAFIVATNISRALLISLGRGHADETISWPRN